MSDKRWESLCERVAFAKTYGTELPLHLALESEFATGFKWPKKHVKHESAVSLGSGKGYMDTVLEGDGFGIIVEVKAPGVELGENQKGQLVSYMELYKTKRDNVKCDYGFLIGDHIEIYFRKDHKNDPELVASFDFNPDSPGGNELAGILFYENCANEKLVEFMNKPHEIKSPPPPVPITAGMEGIGLAFVEILEKEYGEKGVRVFHAVQSGVRWATKSMDEFLPYDEGEKHGEFGGRKYSYTFDIDSKQNTVYLELHPFRQDTKTIEKMNAIAAMYNKKQIVPDDRWRKMTVEKFNPHNDETEEIRSRIDSLLNVEKRILDELEPRYEKQSEARE